MVSTNPFAAPETDVFAPRTDQNVAGSRGQFRLNNLLIHHRSGEFADRCVKCNAPANGETLKRTLYWHHPAIYLLIIPGVLFYAVVALIARKNAVVHIGICERHRSLRRTAIIAGWLGAVLGIGSCSGGLSADVPAAAGFGVLVLLGAVIYGMIGSRAVTPAKIDDEYARIRGVCQPYLDQLPVWPGA